MQGHEIRQHTAHGWVEVNTDHIHNVPFLETHVLMSCPCGFYGWVPA